VASEALRRIPVLSCDDAALVPKYVVRALTLLVS